MYLYYEDEPNFEHAFKSIFLAILDNLRKIYGYDTHTRKQNSYHCIQGLMFELGSSFSWPIAKVL